MSWKSFEFENTEYRIPKSNPDPKSRIPNWSECNLTYFLVITATYFFGRRRSFSQCRVTFLFVFHPLSNSILWHSNFSEASLFTTRFSIWRTISHFCFKGYFLVSFHSRHLSQLPLDQKNCLYLNSVHSKRSLKLSFKPCA